MRVTHRTFEKRIVGRW